MRRHCLVDWRKTDFIKQLFTGQDSRSWVKKGVSQYNTAV